MTKNITLSLPDDLAENISKFPEVNWSSVARKCIENYIENRSKPDLTYLLEKLNEEKGQEYVRGRKFGTSIAEKLGYKNLSELVREYSKEREEWDAIRFQGAIGPFDKYEDETDTIEKVSLKKVPEIKGSSEAFLKGFREVILEINTLLSK